MSTYQLYHGDCLDVLKTFEDNSIDAIVTDPPAGISFMGKGWDQDKGGREKWIAWMQSVASECLRVIKPGGHALVWSIPRTSHWTGTAWENGGWDPRDKVYHCFGSGFPKSLDVSKAIDREAGADREVVGDGQYSNRRPSTRRVIDGGDPVDYHFGNGDNITSPATDEAREWEGWGTALKPAIEEWWLFRKPFDSTVAQNVLTYGTGALNIDGCRVDTEDESSRAGGRRPTTHEGYQRPNATMFQDKTDWDMSPQGRWPANLITDGSEEVIDLFPNTTSGMMQAGQQRKQTIGGGGYHGDFPDEATAEDTYGDSGSAVRFFYAAKASKLDREEGLEGVDPKQRDTGRKEGNPGGDNPRNRGVNKRKNNHPTVKPVSLMRYLCRLITPPGGTVLDCFMGSGSTGKGAVLEGFNFIGIEEDKADEGIVEIARLRIEWAMKEKEKIDAQPMLMELASIPVVKPVQVSLFGEL